MPHTSVHFLWIIWYMVMHQFIHHAIVFQTNILSFVFHNKILWNIMLLKRWMLRIDWEILRKMLCFTWITMLCAICCLCHLLNYILYLIQNILPFNLQIIHFRRKQLLYRGLLKWISSMQKWCRALSMNNCPWSCPTTNGDRAPPHSLSQWWRDVFMCNTVHIRRYNVKSHWKVQGRNSTPE